MARILASIAIWIALLTAVAAFNRTAQPPHTDHHAHTPQTALGNFQLELLATFPPSPDPFADQPYAIRLIGPSATILYLAEEPLPAAQPILVGPLINIPAGKQQFWIDAGLPPEQAHTPQAIRVRLLRNGLTLAETILFAEPGQAVAGPITLDIPPGLGPEPNTP